MILACCEYSIRESGTAGLLWKQAQDEFSDWKPLKHIVIPATSFNHYSYKNEPKLPRKSSPRGYLDPKGEPCCCFKQVLPGKTAVGLVAPSPVEVHLFHFLHQFGPLVTSHSLQPLQTFWNNSETDTISRDRIIWELVFSVIQGSKMPSCSI